MKTFLILFIGFYLVPMIIARYLNRWLYYTDGLEPDMEMWVLPLINIAFCFRVLLVIIKYYCREFIRNNKAVRWFAGDHWRIK